MYYAGKVNSDPKPIKLDKQDKRNKKGKLAGLSDKRAAEMELYSKLRIEFLKGKICPITKTKATEVHHKKGRIGKLLLDMRFWLGVSHKGHKKITENPNWAIENGYSESRLAK